jgi:hypothetical protein
MPSSATSELKFVFQFLRKKAPKMAPFSFLDDRGG